MEARCSIRMSREVGDEFGLTIALTEAAETAEMRGEYDGAAGLLERAIEITERVGFSGKPLAMRARLANVETLRGNVMNKEVLAATNLSNARCLLVAIPDAFEGGTAVELARKANPALKIIARSHSEEETGHLLKHGASEVVMGEHEIAKAMIAGIPVAPA